jgi:predicted MFS family arabinose efflux permease
MKASGYEGRMESVFAKGQIVTGIAMLTGSIAGGYLAQVTNLGVPYIIRAGTLVLSFVLALFLMRDVGFEPRRGGRFLDEVKNVLRNAVHHGLGKRPVRWLMLASIFTGGVMMYAFYAMQPYLLQLYGNSKSYGIAGLAAAIVAGAQIAGGLLVPYIGRIFARRTTFLLTGTLLSAVILALIGMLPRFWFAIALLVLWAFLFAAIMPIRQAYLNALIPSEQRATVLSFDSMLGSTGGVAVQPLLGRAADVWGYPASYLCSAAVEALALPFIWLAKRERAPSDDASRREPFSPGVGGEGAEGG